MAGVAVECGEREEESGGDGSDGGNGRCGRSRSGCGHGSRRWREIARGGTLLRPDQHRGPIIGSDGDIVLKSLTRVEGSGCDVGWGRGGVAGADSDIELNCADLP